MIMCFLLKYAFDRIHTVDLCTIPTEILFGGTPKEKSVLLALHPCNQDAFDFINHFRVLREENNTMIAMNAITSRSVAAAAVGLTRVRPSGAWGLQGFNFPPAAPAAAAARHAKVDHPGGERQ